MDEKKTPEMTPDASVEIIRGKGLEHLEKYQEKKMLWRWLRLLFVRIDF